MESRFSLIGPLESGMVDDYVKVADRDIDKLISSDPNRPLSNSKQALQQMHKERYPLYQKYASYVAVNNANIEETVDDIVNAYHSILIDAVAE